jgi:branched-chain amino acid transport system substrate-binding protein
MAPPLTRDEGSDPSVTAGKAWTRRSVTAVLETTAVLGHRVYAQSGVPGLSDRQIALSVSVDLTGPVSTQVKVVFSGAQLYFDQLNLRGGVHGRTILLKLLDDGFNPARTVANIEKVDAEGKTFAVDLPQYCSFK